MKKIKKFCILLNHHDDIKLFSKSFLNKADLICKNFYVKLELKKLDIKIKELKLKNFNNKKNDFFYNFKSNWFKDKHNKDYTFFENKFSIGDISKDYITRDLITFYKNYCLYLQLKKKYDKVFISSKEVDYFKKFVDTSKNFFYYKTSNSYMDFTKRDVSTKFDDNLIKVKNYFIIFRVLQNFIKLFLLNKSLIFNDPSFKFFFKKKNYLILNSINIFRSFYFIKPSKIQKNLSNNYRKMIKQNLIKFDLPQDFTNIFAEHVYRKLKNNIKLFNTYYSIIHEMINFYRPKTLIVPSLKTFQSLIAQYACINCNVNIIHATDGSNIGLFNDISFDKKFLEDNKINFIAYSAEEQKYFKKMVNNKNIKLSSLPLHLNFKENFKKKYDLIVLDYFWSFNNNNINSKRDYSYKILYDILLTFEKTNKKNIAIKFKQTTSQIYFEYKKFVKNNILNFFPGLNIDFLEGNFSETLNYSNIFIGGIQTSFIEAIYTKKKYIIYLPNEVGYDDNCVNKFSIYIKSKQVVRSLNRLKKEITSKDKIKLKKKLNKFW